MSRKTNYLVASQSVVVASAVLTVAMAGALLPTAFLQNQAATASVIVVVIGAGTLFSALVTLRLVDRDRTIAVQIALGGLPRAGKTVFVNVLYALLMESRGPANISFTPDVVTARYVNSAVSNLGKGIWPGTTLAEGVYRYRAHVGPRRRSRLSAFLGLVNITKLELGDTAGEVWVDRGGGRDNGDLGLTQTPFFEYVTESDVLFYLIDCGELVSDSGLARRSIDDLLSSVQLLRSMKSHSRSQRLRVAVILSKSDLLSHKQRAALGSFIDGGQLAHITEDETLLSALGQLERARVVLDGAADSSRFFIVSAAIAASHAKIASQIRDVVIANDFSDDDEMLQLLSPLLWAIQRRAAFPRLSSLLGVGRLSTRRN